MKKLPINEAAEFLKISKEAVYNRIRRGSLEVTEKNGQKFVILDDEENGQSLAKSTQKSKTTKKSEPKEQKQDKFIEFLLSELTELKERNQNLQSDKERLFKEKEQMLVDSKAEIMAVYKDRDEKLMQFLNAMQKPFLSHTADKTEPVIDAEIDDKDEITQKKFINLSEYLNAINLEKKELKKIQKKIIKRINKSKFIKFKDGVILVKKDKDIKQILGEL